MEKLIKDFEIPNKYGLKQTIGDTIGIGGIMRGLRTWFEPMDYWFGIIKGFFFGISITSIACFYGFNTKGGAAGVGRTTTATVVVSCVAIVFLDYILGEIILL